MYEPIAAQIARRLTAREATSALPDAPARAAPPLRPSRGVDTRLRGLAARRLVGLAGRLDPSVRASG
jgi:hypothetical protein